jgi:hypothetical protein
MRPAVPSLFQVLVNSPVPRNRACPSQTRLRHSRCGITLGGKARARLHAFSRKRILIEIEPCCKGADARCNSDCNWSHKPFLLVMQRMRPAIEAGLVLPAGSRGAIYGTSSRDRISCSWILQLALFCEGEARPVHRGPPGSSAVSPEMRKCAPQSVSTDSGFVYVNLCVKSDFDRQKFS